MTLNLKHSEIIISVLLSQEEVQVSGQAPGPQQWEEASREKIQIPGQETGQEVRGPGGQEVPGSRQEGEWRHREAGHHLGGRERRQHRNHQQQPSETGRTGQITITHQSFTQFHYQARQARGGAARGAPARGARGGRTRGLLNRRGQW